jgi:hypothetical protein
MEPKDCFQLSLKTKNGTHISNSKKEKFLYGFFKFNILSPQFEDSRPLHPKHFNNPKGERILIAKLFISFQYFCESLRRQEFLLGFLNDKRKNNHRVHRDHREEKLESNSVISVDPAVVFH